MAEPDLIELFVRPLNELGVRYMVSGSVAAMLFLSNAPLSLLFF